MLYVVFFFGSFTTSGFDLCAVCQLNIRCLTPIQLYTDGAAPYPALSVFLGGGNGKVTGAVGQPV